MSSDEHFWLAFWLILCTTACIIIACLCFSPFSNTTVEMAKAGYVQKVLVIGDPNNTYTRHMQMVWVKENQTPQVEAK
jgi:hypothetical protein